MPKTQREAIVRAFGETAQTRTWNLLIDLVAQTGYYKPNATSLQNDFIVKGEEHYWVHLAIDRFTNQVVEKRIEGRKDFVHVPRKRKAPWEPRSFAELIRFRARLRRDYGEAGIAIDRFEATIVGQQLEEVME